MSLAYGAGIFVLFVPSAAFWFLPAGLRLAALWVTPPRRWADLFAAEAVALSLVAFIRGGEFGWLELAVSCLLPISLYAGVLLALPQRWREQPAEAATLTLRLLLAGGLAGLLSSLFVMLREANPTTSGHSVLESAGGWIGVISLETLASAPWFALGDLIGVLVLTPLLLGCWQGDRAALLRCLRPSTLLVLALPAACLLGLEWLLRGSHPIAPLAFGAALLLANAHRLGWHSAVVSNLLLSAALRTASLLGMVELGPHELQLLAAVLLCAALLLGASSDALRQRLQEANVAAQLLDEQRSALRQAAGRLVGAQDLERERIGRDLHDAVGQSLTAARTVLRLSRRRLTDAEGQGRFDELNALLARAQDDLREVIGSLHSVDVARNGLSETMRRGPIAQMAFDAGLEYSCDIDLALPLDAQLASGLYRICQEAATNVVKACRANRLSFSIRSGIDDEGRGWCELRQDDDGGAFVAGFRPRYGLQNIADRALALGAEYRLSPQSGAPRHWLRAPVTMDPDIEARAAGSRSGPAMA